jgi:hypothetical protein
MDGQHIDLLRVGELALRALPFLTRGNRYAAGVVEMYRSTGLPVAACEKTIETLARQASQQEYEKNLRAITETAKHLTALEGRAAAGDRIARNELKELGHGE